jgi:hypothetical protein
LIAGRLKLAGAVLATLALGVAIGRVSGTTSGVRASKDEDGATLRKLDALEGQVRHLAARAPAVVQLGPAPIDGSAARALSAATAQLPAPGEEAATPAPTDEQIAAGDRLVTVADAIIQKGRLTAEDRRALRAALAASDPERREATMLTLVRAMNEQRLKPTEPGPPF